MGKIAVNADNVNTGAYTTSGAGTDVDPLVSATQAFVTISGVAVLRAFDTVPDHATWAYGPFGGAYTTSEHYVNNLVENQNFVTINGIPVAMNENSSTCGHLLQTGQSFVTIREGSFVYSPTISTV